MLRRRPLRTRRPVFTWRTFVFEVVVVVLGVLIALGANETREWWRNRRKAQMLSEALVLEYETNCRRFQQAVDYHAPLLAELDSVIAVHPEADSPQALPSARNGLSPALPTTAVYETALATGDISLLGFDVALGLGNVAEITTLYRETVDRMLDAISQRDATLADLRQPYTLMRELQGVSRRSTCRAYEGLARRAGAPVDSTLLRGTGDGPG